MRKILCVDDEEMVLHTFRRVLEHHGYHVRTATNGNDALAAIRGDHEIDMLIIDFFMPGENGLDTIARIRQTHPRLPITMITGYGTEEIRQRVMDDYGCGYLIKPVSSADLISNIKQHAPLNPQ